MKQAFTRHKKNTLQTTGFALVELLVSVSLIAVVMLSLIGLAAHNVRLSSVLVEYVQADYLLEEGAEAVKLIRNDSWSNFEALEYETAYGLVFTDNTWALSETPESIDSFTRSVTFSSVERDDVTGAVGDGSLDEQTLLANVSVNWDSSFGPKDRTLSFYITDFFAD